MHLCRFAVALACVAAVQATAIQSPGCSHDNCYRAFLGKGSVAVSYCASYVPGAAIPTYAANCNGNDKRVQSACSCLYTAPSSAPAASTSTSTSSTVSSTLAPSTSTSPTPSTSTTAPATTAPAACHCTEWSQIAAAQTACKHITLDNIAVPASSGLPLTKLQPGATVTFVGNTSFAYTPRNAYKMVQITGNNVVIKGAPGSFFDGGGPLYWDGLGNNGGLSKPGNFMKVTLTNNSIMEDLYVLNTPSHAINVAGCTDSVIQRITVNNSLGDAPNAISNGLAAGHNTDAFNVGNVKNLLMQDCKVWNQDDCVALSLADNATFRNFYCHGSHGLSIAGGGSGPNQNITNILFADSVVDSSLYGLRIKTDYNATGSVVNVTYANIKVANIQKQGIDIEQDYLNGGPNGLATNGVAITNILFKHISGWVAPKASAYYVLCGVGSCNNIVYEDVQIAAGTVASSCNAPWSGCPGP